MLRGYGVRPKTTRRSERRPISRVLFSGRLPGRNGDHFSGIRVAANLERPTREFQPARRAASSSPIWPFSGRGLPCRPCHQGRGELLPRHFTLTTRRTRGGVFSVALSLGLLPVPVGDRPALRSSDFPPSGLRQPVTRRAAAWPPFANGILPRSRGKQEGKSRDLGPLASPAILRGL